MPHNNSMVEHTAIVAQRCLGEKIARVHLSFFDEDSNVDADSSDEQSSYSDESEAEATFIQPNKSDTIHETTQNILSAKEATDQIKVNNLEDYVTDNHPDDETRHNLALLSFPPDKVWEDKDLDDECNMKAGLHLLYNKINGKQTIHFGKSIHIKYEAFLRDVINTMKARSEITKHQLAVAEARAF